MIKNPYLQEHRVNLILGQQNQFTARSIALDLGDKNKVYSVTFTLAELESRKRIVCVGLDNVSEKVYEVIK